MQRVTRRAAPPTIGVVPHLSRGRPPGDKRS